MMIIVRGLAVPAGLEVLLLKKRVIVIYGTLGQGIATVPMIVSTNNLICTIFMRHY